jgi:hypothetical protein
MESRRGRVGNKLTREIWSLLHHKLQSMRWYWGRLVKSNLVNVREEMNVWRHITKITTFSSDIHQKLLRTCMWATDGFFSVWCQFRCWFTQRESRSDEPSIDVLINLHVHIHFQSISWPIHFLVGLCVMGSRLFHSFYSWIQVFFSSFMIQWLFTGLFHLNVVHWWTFQVSCSMPVLH